MTPTQAQIEAAAKAIEKLWYTESGDALGVFKMMAQAALTAAAEVAMHDAEEADTARALDVVSRDFGIAAAEAGEKEDALDYMLRKSSAAIAYSRITYVRSLLSRS